MRTHLKIASALGMAAALVVAACDFHITNPNSPAPIGPNATPDQVKSAAIGTLVAVRVDVPRWVLAGAILGREGYRLDTADPRFTTELLQGPLDPSNDAFGGGQWAAEYRAIQSGYQILNVIGSAQIDAGQQNAVRGFVHTIQALAFLMVLNAHTEDSIPVQVNGPINSLAPFVSNDSAYKFVIGLLDSARTELTAATAFPFDPGAGFSAFNTPTTFLKFNRGLAARVWTYRASPSAPGVNCIACRDSAAAALAASFMDPAASMDLGAYHVFSTGNQDTPNPLAQNPASAVNLVHPFIKDSADTQNVAGRIKDKRFLAKVTDRKSPVETVPDTFSLSCLSSALAWARYPTPNSSIPILRNEELILLDAESQWFKTVPNKAQAIADLNTIRQTSGGLAPTTVTIASTDAAFVNDLLKQRLYSLLYENGNRWLDMRRYGRLSQVIRDRPNACTAKPNSGITKPDTVFSTLPVNSFEVQARQ